MEWFNKKMWGLNKKIKALNKKMKAWKWKDSIRTLWDFNRNLKKPIRKWIDFDQTWKDFIRQSRGKL